MMVGTKYQGHKPLDNNIWSHIVAVWNGFTQKATLYVNSDTPMTADIYNGDGHAYFCTNDRPGFNHEWNGCLSHIAVYGRALNIDRVFQLQQNFNMLCPDNREPECLADRECLVPRLCYQITDKPTCLSSRDSRPGYINEPCTWCNSGPCTESNANRCEPVEWLFKQTKLLNPSDYTVASSTELTPRECYTIQDASICLSSKDNRAQYLDQPCVWCVASPCTKDNDNRCQPA
eukprot:81810_1